MVVLSGEIPLIAKLNYLFFISNFITDIMRVKRSDRELKHMTSKKMKWMPL